MYSFKISGVLQEPRPPHTKWGSYPVIKVGFDRREMENLDFVGVVPATPNLKDSGDTYFRVESRFTGLYGEAGRNGLMEIAGDTYYISRPVICNVENVIESWDEKLSCSYAETESHKRGRMFLNAMYGSICKDSVMTEEEILETVDFQTSPGYPGNLWGIPSKGHLIRDDKFLEWWWKFRENYLNIPFYSISPKREYLPLSDLKLKSEGGRQKLRLFMIPPYHLLYEQLRFGKRISNRLKGYGWSAYGFNPYKGGVHEMALRLLSKRNRFFYDVSGWDKFLPLMREIYDFISAHDGSDEFGPSIKRAYDWMKTHSVEYYCKMWDGTVYLKSYGNASGSGTTTRDNILAHILIVASYLSEAYFLKNGTYPSNSELNDQVIYIYGDDFVGSVDDAFDFVLIDGFLDEFFQRYGMKLKFIKGGPDFPLQEMQFLGFNFNKVSESWIPKFDTVRLATTMIYDGVDPLNREAFISRAFMLYFMSFGSPDHEIFKIAYGNLVDNMRGRTDLTKTEEVFISLGVLSDSEMFEFYLGSEGSKNGEFLEFFSCLEEVGFKNPVLSHGNQT